MSESDEIEFFNHLAKEWWDPAGPQAMLHKINPLRVRWISQFIPLKDSKILDLGCGAGLLSEALAEQGAVVTGLDLGEDLIEVAKSRQSKADYHCMRIQDFAQNHLEAFDAVTCLEMLEHVEDFDAIIRDIVTVLKPGGKVFFSTLDRTPRSFFEAIVGAEYLLKLIPKGTHHYGQFIRPDELSSAMREYRLEPISMEGLKYHPLLKTFSLSPKLRTNYWVVGQKL